MVILLCLTPQTAARFDGPLEKGPTPDNPRILRLTMANQKRRSVYYREIPFAPGTQCSRLRTELRESLRRLVIARVSV